MDADQFTQSVNVGPIYSSVLTQQEHHRSTNIWQGNDPGPLKCRRGDGSIPWSSIDERVVPYLIKAGFYGIYRIGAIKFDWALITALAERWRMETHTFHLPVGEATITLQDVEVLTGLPIDGDVVSGIDVIHSTEEWQGICLDLFGVLPPPSAFAGRMLKLKWLMDQFKEALPDDATDVSVQYCARALILAMIGGIVLPNLSGNKVDLKYIPFLRNFDTIGSFSWGSAALAFLYRELCRTTDPNKDQIGGCLTLLQIWAWERIRCMRPDIEHGLQYVPQIDPPGPLGYKWRAAKLLEHVPTHVLRVYRDQLNLLTDNQFEWQPYQLDELPHYCRQGENTWRSRVPLICFDRVEWHFPDRVLRQYGLWQDIPRPCDTISAVHDLDLRGRNQVDWSLYYESYVNIWEGRELEIVEPNAGGENVGCSEAYKNWYRNITRLLISDPHQRYQSDVTGYMGTSAGYEGLIQELERINLLLGEFHIHHDAQKVTEAQEHVVNALTFVGEQERLSGQVQVPPTYAYNAPPTEFHRQTRKRRAVPQGPAHASPPATSDAPASSSVPPPAHNVGFVPPPHNVGFVVPPQYMSTPTQVECVTQVGTSGSQAEPSNRQRRLTQRERRERRAPDRYTPSQ